MQVLSPVGEFKVAVDGVRIRDGRLVVHMSMGAWRSRPRSSVVTCPTLVSPRACSSARSIWVVSQ